MPGVAPKRAGNRAERIVVRELQDRGIAAKRVPLSGAVETYPGDIDLPPIAGYDVHTVGEVKYRTRAWGDLYTWIQDRDVLFLKAARKPTLVVMALDTFTDMVKHGQTVSPAVDAETIVFSSPEHAWTDPRV